MTEIETCWETLLWPGKCCKADIRQLPNGVTDHGDCEQPVAYVMLVRLADSMVEHLRCVEHMAIDRAGWLPILAIKTYHSRESA